MRSLTEVIPCIPSCYFYILFFGFLVGGCAQSTKNLSVVDNFEAQRYMGVWYEIARFPHRFENGLTNVTATYSFIDDTTVEVINRGYSAEKGTWKEATGKARFADSPDRGFLKVTFFWPFSGAYKVLVLDQANYGYALVTSSNYGYLWILARSPKLDEIIYQALVNHAEEYGFDTTKLIQVDQSMHIEDNTNN